MSSDDPATSTVIMIIRIIKIAATMPTERVTTMMVSFRLLRLSLTAYRSKREGWEKGERI